MEGIGAEVNQKVKSAIKAKLVELGVYVDEELPDYIMVMVANKRTKSEMIEDLQLFLGAFTEKFISWLLQVLQKLHEVTAASIDAKRTSLSLPVDKESEKIIKKRKIPSTEAEPESVKKNRRKKPELIIKDKDKEKDKEMSYKKVKKSNIIKKKPGKPEVGKVLEKRLSDKTEITHKDKKDAEKHKDPVSSTVVEKSNQSTLQPIIRPNPKPVLMVSDEDDEDFINIRADAEADLVSELQEEVKPSPPPQKPVAQVSSLRSNENVSHRLSDTSQESSVRTQKVTRESIVSVHKDTRMYRSDDNYAVAKTHLESVAHFSSKPEIASKIQGIASVVDSYCDSGDHQRKDEEKSFGQQRVQPASKVTLVSHTGSIKSRLGKRPSKEDSPPRSERMKPKGVPSVVKVKGRPKVPLAAQANKNLILKAVAEAQKSVASSLIRPEPIIKSQGLLTKKNRGEFSKIAVTLPNPRISSTAQPVRRTPQDENDQDHFVQQPSISRDVLGSLHSQSRQSSLLSSENVSSTRNLPSSRGVVSSGDHTVGNNLLSNEVLPRSELPSVNSNTSLNTSLPTRSSANVEVSSYVMSTRQPEQKSHHNLSHTQDQSIFSSSRLSAVNLQEPTRNIVQHPQPFKSQVTYSLQLINRKSQLISQQSKNQSQLIQTQPQPDIVASLHEGHVIQSCGSQVSRSSVERIATTECLENSVDGSQSKQAPDLCGEMEYQNGDSSRDAENGPFQEGMSACTDMEEESVGTRAKSVSPTVDSPIQRRPCSPQFFVTLNGYDPQLQNSSSRIVRSNLSDIPRCILVPEEMEEDEEFIDEGIEDVDMNQESMNVNESVMMDSEMEKGIQSAGTITFRNVGEENLEDDNEMSMKVKNIERCRFWPACRSGERCEFYHPTTPCKVFPACKFGDKCLYIHPNCKFDAACTRKDCPFTHAIPRSLVIAPVPAPIRAPPRPAQIQCKFFPKCTNVNCKFFHPKPCRFGKACNKYDCPFIHEREQLPPKEKLKWICPTKV